MEKLNKHQKRLVKLAAAYQRLVDEGHLSQADCDAAQEEVRTLSAADVAVEYSIHVTNNF